MIYMDNIMGLNVGKFLLGMCPRCRGDFYLESDLYGAYLKCIQCGHIHPIPTRELIDKVGQRK